MKTIFYTFLSLFVLCQVSFAQTPDKPSPVTPTPNDKKDSSKTPEKTDSPVNITSDKMRYDEANNLIYFTGNVHVDDGSMKVNCDRMTVKLDEKQDPKLIICEENVVIRKETTVSNSDKAEYFLPEEKIVLTGNPKITRINDKGKEQVTRGKVIIFYKNTNIIEIEGVSTNFGGDKKETPQTNPKDVE